MYVCFNIFRFRVDRFIIQKVPINIWWDALYFAMSSRYTVATAMHWLQSPSGRENQLRLWRKCLKRYRKRSDTRYIMRARERATTFDVENEIFREKKISSKIESNPKITFFYFIKNIVFKKFCCCGAAFEANKDFSVQCESSAFVDLPNQVRLMMMQW